MKSPFGQKLFRLFLLFALVPSFILAAVGYYIASQEGPVSSASPPHRVSELADYYNRYLFDMIETGITGWEESSYADTGSLDFLFSLDNDTPRVIRAAIDLPHDAIVQMIQTADTKPRGFVRVDTVYYQYATSRNNSGQVIIGGLVHDQSYVTLTEFIQTDLGAISSRRALTSNYALFLAILFLALAVATAALAYYFSARISRTLASPLTSLSEASIRIAGGDFSQRVEVSGSGEIKTLIDNFNRMAQQLRTTTSRLAQTERVAAWRNVARRFAHELKNPLQPILVSIYRLENALKDSDQYQSLRQPLQAATEELQHLTRLAERFSELAKLPEPKLERTNLNDFLQSIADLYADRLTPYDFKMDIPAETIWVDIDITYFREALHNLLQNAIEASSEGGRVGLILRHENGTAVIEVKDSGHGMSAEVSASARMPYFTTKAGGSGIGLAVVDKVVSEINGSMLIDSAEGRGTTVTISIPARSDRD